MIIKNKRKTKLLGLTLGAAFAAAFLFIIISSFQYSENAFDKMSQIKPPGNFTCAIAGEEIGTIDLPHRIKGLKPRTKITLLTELEVTPKESLLIKTAFSPIQVYYDDVLVYEAGQENSYPAYMKDPPTIMSVIPLPAEKSNTQLRIEYLSPQSRSEISLSAIFKGEEISILAHQFYADGFSFLFSLLLIFIGLVMSIVALTVMAKIAEGSSFLWLGLFALAAGIWGLGECDLSVLLLPWPTTFHFMAYLGLFTITIPFLHFGLIMLQPKNKLSLQLILGLHYISLGIALVLQLTGQMDFIKILYVFHIIAPLGFVSFALNLVFEHFRYKNPAAKRFVVAVVLLALATVLELINYYFHLVSSLTLFFQLGVLAFIVALGVASGYYVRESIQTAAKKKQLEKKMETVAKQLELQRLQYLKIREKDAMVKAQRHDLRHQLAVLRDLCEQEKIKKLRNYLDTLIQNIPADKGLLLCENYAINAVAAHYYTKGMQASIDIKAQLPLPGELDSDLEVDLCIVIGNLLENAIEACLCHEHNKPFIRIVGKQRYDTLIITCDNSFEGSIRQNGDRFLSTKREGEGTGLSSIRAVAEKYNGAFNIAVEKGVFQASVYVNLPEKDKPDCILDNAVKINTQSQ